MPGTDGEISKRDGGHVTIETVSHDPSGCRALPRRCVIHCDRSSSSAHSDLTVVLRPPLLSLHRCPRWRLMPCIFHRWSKQQQRCSHSIQAQVIMKISMMECPTLHSRTQTKPNNGLRNQGCPNKHALSANGFQHPVTTPGVQLQHVMQPQLMYRHINNN